MLFGPIITPRYLGLDFSHLLCYLFSPSRSPTLYVCCVQFSRIAIFSFSLEPSSPFWLRLTQEIQRRSQIWTAANTLCCLISSTLHCALHFYFFRLAVFGVCLKPSPPERTQILCCTACYDPLWSSGPVWTIRKCCTAYYDDPVWSSGPAVRFLTPTRCDREIRYS